MQLKLIITDLNVKKAQYRQKTKIKKSQNESRSKQELKFTVISEPRRLILKVIALLAGDVAELVRSPRINL